MALGGLFWRRRPPAREITGSGEHGDSGGNGGNGGSTARRPGALLLPPPAVSTGDHLRRLLDGFGNLAIM